MNWVWELKLHQNNTNTINNIKLCSQPCERRKNTKVSYFCSHLCPNDKSSPKVWSKVFFIGTSSTCAADQQWGFVSLLSSFYTDSNMGNVIPCGGKITFWFFLKVSFCRTVKWEPVLRMIYKMKDVCVAWNLYIYWS